MTPLHLLFRPPCACYPPLPRTPMSALPSAAPRGPLAGRRIAFGRAPRRLASGRIVEITEAPDTLRVSTPEGDLLVELQFGADGMTLRGRAVRLELAAESVHIAAERLALEGREVHIQAGERLTLASNGEVGMTAAADVVVAGARVRLN